MKLFKFVDYSKPGKGIDPNEKPKPAFIRYWIILWRKRFKLIATNWMFLLPNILSPFIAMASFYVAFSLYASMSGVTVSDLLATENAMTVFRWAMMLVAVLCTVIPIFSFGPSFAGCTFLYRSYTREEPVFLWSDFTSKMKTNMKLGLKVTFTNAIAAFVLMVDVAAYRAIIDNRSGAFPQIPFIIAFIFVAVILFAIVMLFMVSMYVYPMMVTFNITYKQLYKNAMILSIARWLPNLGMLLLEIVLAFLPMYLMQGEGKQQLFWFSLTVFLYLFITPAFFGFTNTFYVWPTIKKYMIDNPNADKSEKKPEEEKKEEETPKETGRFENGRWIENDEENAADTSSNEEHAAETKHAAEETEEKYITKEEKGTEKD